MSPYERMYRRPHLVPGVSQWLSGKESACKAGVEGDMGGDRSPFQSLGGEVPLEGEMATHSRILAWRIPMDRGHGRLLSIGSQSWTRLK